MNRLWDYSKYHPKLLLHCDKSRSSWDARSKKIKFKSLGLGVVIYAFWSDFRQNAKNEPRKPFNGPNRENENQEKCRNIVNSVKSGENGKCLKASIIYTFEETRNRKTPKDVKLNALQKWLSRMIDNLQI